MSFIFSLMVIHLVALMTPGPDFFFVTQTAVSRSRAEALYGVTGITLGVVFWAALSLIGLQWIFEQFAWLHRGLLVAGGLYLMWMGYNLLKSALRKPEASEGGAKPAELPVSKVRAFTMGLFTNLANAKAVVYFSSIFSMMLTPRYELFHALGDFWHCCRRNVPLVCACGTRVSPSCDAPRLSALISLD